MRGIRRIPCGNVNCYLVQGEEGAVLVDTGYTGYVERLLDTCLGAGVRLIVLTHGHLDHIQNTALLMERLGVPSLSIRRIWACSPISNLSPCPPRDRRAGSCCLSPVTASRPRRSSLLHPQWSCGKGTAWPPGGVDARVLELPGHTAGSIGLDVEGHSLIVGDAMMNLFRPGPSCLCSDPAAQRDSIARIRSLGPRSLYFGHGRPAHLPG